MFIICLKNVIILLIEMVMIKMTIEKFARFKWLSILIWGLINVITITVGVVGFMKENYYSIYLYFPEIVFLIVFIFSFCISYKKYYFNDTEIICYAGWEKHLLIINGDLVDEHNTFLSFTPVELTYKDDNHEYYMRVSLSNSITVKVDGKLIKN